MTGLILKDFLVMRKTLKTYTLFLIFYAALAALGALPLATVTAMVQIILIMLPISAFSYDEFAKWDRYVLTLPLGRPPSGCWPVCCCPCSVRKVLGKIWPPS